MFRVKRVYDPKSEEDGLRVLVDRLWPRGVKRDAVDLWLQEAAPSDSLRRFFSHDPARWPAFVARYHAELDQRPRVVEQLITLARRGPVTLLYAARDREHNHAVALKAYLEERLRGRAAASSDRGAPA